MVLLGLFVLALLAGGSADASIRIKTDVSEVKVWLDGQEAGQAPLTISPVPPGSHRITLMKPGYEDHVEEVQVQPGGIVKLFVVMKRSAVVLPELPAQFRVVHQHRSGSCEGTLTVSAEALDYRSDDGKDVFHIPIASIRSVVRSMGRQPVIGTYQPLSAMLPGDMAALRIETPGRSYGFMAGVSFAQPDEIGGTVSDEVMISETKRLFEIVYQLSTEHLNAKRKAPAK